jgi:predicted kinase
MIVGKTDQLVFKVAGSISSICFPWGNVTFDATNLTVERRLKYINLAKMAGTQVTVHWVDSPLKVAIHRNAKRDRKVPVPVIKALHNSLEPPTISEGMDQIIVYRQDLSVRDEIT